MKVYYQNLSKEKKVEIKNIYKEEYKNSNIKTRLTRLKFYTIIGYAFSLLLFIEAFKNKKVLVTNIIIAICLIIISTIFIIGSSKIKLKLLNKIALEKKKK